VTTVTDTNDQVGANDPSVGVIALKTAGHLLGIAVIATALIALAMPIRALLPFLGEIVAHHKFAELTGVEFAIHFGLATVMWLAAVFLYHQFTRIKEVKTVKLQEQAGAVLAETIVVLPVMLLIIFGLAQVAVNNIAGMLANVAAYEGARSAWVWAPEINEGRMDGGIDTAAVDERAKIAAALVMTPVAPGDYRQQGLTGFSDEFKNVRKAMFVGQFPVGAAPPVSSALSTGGNLELRFSKALDESSFTERTAKKLTHAYMSVSKADAQVQNEEMVFDFEYLHYQGFPIVGLFLGERVITTSAPGGRAGYYSRIKRKVKFPMRKCDTQWSSTKLCPPNPNTP
jgi:hypothetical protein